MTVASAVLARWNALSASDAAAEILPCCGSARWAHELAHARPFEDEAALFALSDRIWLALPSADHDEAFRSHPRIGERKAPAVATRKSAEWSKSEQSGIASSDTETLAELARCNRLYEERFGCVFLVCATGRSAAEMLDILRRRLQSDPDTELREAIEQQRLITHIRLRKWLDAGKGVDPL